MAEPPPLLRHQDVVRAIDGIDVLDVVSRELVRRHHGTDLAGTGGVEVAVSTEVTTVEGVCALPTPSLHMVGYAALAALAVRVLLGPAAVTATVLGEGPAAHLHLALIARYTPRLTGATVRSAADRPGPNLVVVAEAGWGAPVVEPPRPGGLIVNASRRDLPDRVLAEVDRLYVDDLGSLAHNQHRRFVQWHLAQDRRADPGRAPWRDRRRIDRDLGHLVCGAAAPVADDVVLVELINGGSLLARLAAATYHALRGP